MFYVELLSTICLSYVVSEVWRPPDKRWELLRALSPLSWGGLRSMVLIVFSISFLGLLAMVGFGDWPQPNYNEPIERDLELAYQAQTRKAVLTVLSFTMLAYFDVRTRVSHDKRVSCLWFLRAAAIAAVKTLLFLAPLLAVLIALPAALLVFWMQRAGYDVKAYEAPLQFCLSYGPYVACYWIIKRDFARSRAAQLPVLPVTVADCDKGMVMRWITGLRRDFELDARLREDEVGSLCACVGRVIKWTIAAWCLLIVYALIALSIEVMEYDDNIYVGNMELVEEGDMLVGSLQAFNLSHVADK